MKEEKQVKRSGLKGISRKVIMDTVARKESKSAAADALGTTPSNLSHYISKHVQKKNKKSKDRQQVKTQITSKDIDLYLHDYSPYSDASMQLERLANDDYLKDLPKAPFEKNRLDKFSPECAAFIIMTHLRKESIHILGTELTCLSHFAKSYNIQPIEQLRKKLILLKKM